MRLKAKPKTFSECMEFYFTDCLARGQSDRTVEVKRSHLNAFAAWCLAEGIRRPAQVTEDALEGYRRYVHAYRQPFNGKPLDIASQRNRMTAVKVFFRRLRRSHILKSDPAELLELPRVPRRLPRAFLTETEVEALLKQTLLYGIRGVRDRAILETYYATGMRRMELARLDMGDIDAKRGTVRINLGKGNKDRYVPIARRACEWVAVYLEKVRPRFARLESGSALFLANDGLRFREHNLTYIASNYVKRAGIKKPGACNLFRHTAATLMHENGADLLYVQELLGHADVSTTQVYTHVTIRKLREVYARTHPAARNTPSIPVIPHGETHRGR